MSIPSLPATLRPIETISPSTAGHAIGRDGCLFMLLAEGSNNHFHPTHNPDGVQKMLPDSGTNVFGTIIHEVMRWAHEKSTVNNHGPVSGAFELWDRLITQKNEELEKQPLNKHIQPLEHINGYMQKRGSICHHAETIRRSSEPPYAVVPTTVVNHADNRITGAEVIVQDDMSAPRVKGKIDLIKDDGTNLELLDWKTGKILDDNNEIKLLYRIQMQLYAALIELKQINLGVSPARFPIRATLKNPETRETATLGSADLNTHLCRQLLDKTILLRKEINDSVIEDNNTNNLMIRLSKPDIKGCRYCPIRPGCGKYLANLVNWMNAVPGNPKDIVIQDVIGEFVKLDRSGPMSSIGTIIIREVLSRTWRVAGLDVVSRTWRVAGIDMDASRNTTSMHSIQPGDTIAIFNIQNNPDCNLSGYIHTKANPITHIVYRF